MKEVRERLTAGLEPEAEVRFFGGGQTFPSRLAKEKTMSQISWTLEPEDDGTFCLFKHDEYERGSVLAGQARRSRRGYYDTVEEALAGNPLITIDVIEHSTKFDIPMSDVPPIGFDPADAGERWSEDY